MPRGTARERKTHQAMADVEMRDESSAALPAALSMPVEVEVPVLEQEGETGAAPMEANARLWGV